MNTATDKSARPTGPGRTTQLEALVYFYAFNVLSLMVAGLGYLSHIPAGTSAYGWFVTLVAYAANFAMLALAPLLLALPALIFRRKWFTVGVAIVLFGALNFFIYADTVIYQLWRFHFNGMVLNLLTTSGAGDSVTAGAGTVWSASLIVVSIVFAETAFGLFALPWLLRRAFATHLRTRKALLWGVAGVAVFIGFDKVMYDVGDLRGDMEVVRLRNILPLYQTVTIKRFANRVLGMNITPDTQVKLAAGAASLNYPRAPLHFRSDGPRPNIVIIALEGARFDTLTPAAMPHLYRWGEQHLVFDEHYSGGNATRYGIFTMLYGIYGTYWPRMLAERHSPVLIDSLKSLGYHFRILCCTDLNYPEFRSTAFIHVPEAITDKWTGDRTDRDRQMTDEFVKFVHERQTPFCMFMFFDASHQPYHYPAEHAVFETGNVTDQINYVKLARSGGDVDVRFLHNRYLNSMHYVDAQIDRALHALSEEGLLENTLVFIAGDHGEAFGELGLFGHDSTFDRYQTQTIMVAHIPGTTPQHIHRLTSHLDVVPTILTYMGVDNPLMDYTEGQPLLDAHPCPYVFITSWDTAALVNRDEIISFGVATYKAETTVLDANGHPLPNQRQVFVTRKPQLLEALQGMRQFTK